MRLKTVMRPYKDGTVYAAGFTDQHAHDAMVAHALFLAMEQWGTDEFGVVDALKSRAAEIMAEWGSSDDGYSADIRIADMGDDRGSK